MLHSSLHFAFRIFRLSLPFPNFSPWLDIQLQFHIQSFPSPENSGFSHNSTKTLRIMDSKVHPNALRAHDITDSTFLHFASYPEYSLGHPTFKYTKAENQQHICVQQLSPSHILHFLQMRSLLWLLTYILAGLMKTFWGGMLTHLNTGKHVGLGFEI